MSGAILSLTPIHLQYQLPRNLCLYFDLTVRLLSRGFVLNERAHFKLNAPSSRVALTPPGIGSAYQSASALFTIALIFVAFGHSSQPSTSTQCILLTPSRCTSILRPLLAMFLGVF